MGREKNILGSTGTAYRAFMDLRGDAMTIQAIYEDGVFKPMEPVAMPDHTLVVLHAEKAPANPQDYSEIWDALAKPVDTGISDLAARHDEHQP